MMRFGGFQPFTLSDYPGRTAAIVFAQGCNFRCPFCHNGSLLSAVADERDLVPEEMVLAELRRRHGLVEGLVVTGGEPTLQAALPAFLGKVKALGLLVKLDTNGSRPEMLARLLRAGLVDYVAMDVKAPREKYDLLVGVKAPLDAVRKSIRLIAGSGVVHHFRTTAPPALLSARDLETIRRELPADSPHRVQEFKPEHALDPVCCGAARTA